MQRFLGVAAILTISGCSLYGGGDDDAPDPGVDAGSNVMVGTYRATWTCSSAPCANPIADTVQAVVVGGDSLTVAWTRNGDPTARVTHLGQMDDVRDCAVMQAGTDLGVPRDAYALCVTSAGVLEAGVAWDGTFSDVVLTRE
jgi:hypothetical protein